MSKLNFYECENCAKKAGSPILCIPCWQRRDIIDALNALQPEECTCKRCSPFYNHYTKLLVNYQKEKIVHMCTTEDMHPYECNGPGKCIHCDRGENDNHNPRTCALCDDGGETEQKEGWEKEFIKFRCSPTSDYLEANYSEVKSFISSLLLSVKAEERKRIEEIVLDKAVKASDIAENYQPRVGVIDMERLSDILTAIK